MGETRHRQKTFFSKAAQMLNGARVGVPDSVKDQELYLRGRKTKDLRTPALLVDLDAMETNLSRMAVFFRDKPAKLRPHFKAHQVFSLASRQMQRGAIGLTCARLDHAEGLVHQGFKNIVIANEIAGEGMIKHFVELSREAPVLVAVDNPKVVADMARIAGYLASELNVLVDLDVRLGRCGVQPGESALSLTKLVLEKGLRFRGLMGYEGHVPLPEGPEKREVAHGALKRLIETKNMLEREGIPVEIVTCGGTSDYSFAGTYPGVTETQAGSYLLMDTWYVPFAPEFKPTLTILATVISETPGERLVADAGVKAMSGANGFPSIKGIPGLRVKALHVEHTLMEISDHNVSVEVGDKIEIWVRSLDATLSLHTHMYGIRGGAVEEVLKIEH
jgi:D-serine deaminase-like pyridoxal phosphate-dependent protein